ncbi:MAG TPA: preprotein translocase subunit SecA [Pirellulaceae bacterium]|nr:preprotein translocase subunit SecA [Pirellulaceae bacterium]
MGFFDSLFGSKKRTNVEVVPDLIWMTTDAKFAGLAKAVEERSKSETVAILLVGHFPDVLARLEELANRRTWRVPLQAVPASNLDTELATSLNLDESAILDIIVGERHPLPSVDDGLEAFADELSCRCRFAHHISLEDPVLEIFGGEWVQNVLRKLGMSEDEAIEAQMVSRRIRQAQQKIEGRAFGSSDAESAAAWLKKNCPELAKK